MAKTVEYIIDRVREVLQDGTAQNDGIRWTNAELIRWINDAQREIAVAKPQSVATKTVVTLASGSEQSLPAEGFLLLRAVRNMSGASPGRAVRIAEMESLVNEFPDWHDDVNSYYDNENMSVAQQYFYEASDPYRFFVFPPNDGTGELEIVYAANPTEVTVLSDPLTTHDIYTNQIVDYVLYRCFMKDNNTASMERAQRHYGLFRESLGLKTQAHFTFSADRKLEESRQDR